MATITNIDAKIGLISMKGSTMKKLTLFVGVFFALIFMRIYPLHMAVERRDMIQVEQYIAHGEDVNAQNKVGSRPLNYALTVETVKRLLAAGADPNGRNAEGDTPLFNLFGGPTWRADPAWTAESIKALVNAGAKVDEQGRYGETALFAAVVGGDEVKVNELLAFNADPTIKDKWGRTLFDVLDDYKARIKDEGLRQTFERIGEVS